ncbi:MAG: transporter substrate-binding domain-containing protein [Ruminococcaceae bacterium]|nr:transporter substrate-binding domain-containing protein [Oscillospiraceae bacterium]
MKKLIAIAMAAVLLLATVAMFASCGKKTEDAQPEEKVVTVGYTDYAPMNYVDETGKLVGFDTELAEKVFGALGYKIIFKEINWDNKYMDLNSGTIDCVWNGFTANCSDDDGVARSSKVDFSYNYMENQQVVVAKKDSGIATAADLAGKAGAAEAGSAGEGFAKENFTEATVKTVLKQTDALMEVKSGASDFAVLDVQLAKSYCGKGDYSDLAIVETLSGDTEFYAIGFKKGSDLTAKVNEQLEALAKSGELLTLAEKYGVATTVITDFTSQK